MSGALRICAGVGKLTAAGAKAVTMTWMQLTALQLRWVHEISQSALAVAIVILGAVIMLELRSIRSMKRTLDSHLARVFEQLDLLRLDSSSGDDPVQGQPVPVPVVAA